ncbi:Uncharacterised protein [Mycobacterium tuberculosis]|nr:Uncharacterised protein [Mycobacterium tuberculosis]
MLSRSGPSYGATTTTRAPLRTPIAAAPTSAGSPGSSPATISTSSGPTQGGAALASTIGSAAPAPSVEARMVPAVSAVPRPVTQITERGRSLPRSKSSSPSSAAAAMARTCAPAIDAARSRAPRSAAIRPSVSSRSIARATFTVRPSHVRSGQRFQR